ncbi:MAG: ABC transporter ATP-binding protein [Proteobacteria bacterium]|nr:ABC transporter ATP-binding protein [Pseudomonadota bacterium]MBU1420180.1 ABC transporter ATP-binding protein [Pseudomonadota bacterium]MBU1455214.1 ABC transporter ATP-binding protein [Pseudomonadota bacterium]
MIQLSAITKSFHTGKTNEFHALKGINLEVSLGEVIVFVGPSGSGKTTLLSIIGCMSRPTSGRIWISGQEITSLPERFAARIRRETFGFIFQNYNLIKGISVLENTMLPAYPLGGKYRLTKERAITLLDKLGIGSKIQEHVEYLSGGEQQRVAIARALINAPSIIIADEPTAHLDTRLAGQLLEIFSGFRKEGKTILIASHDALVFESAVVDRVIAMRDGSVVK